MTKEQIEYYKGLRTFSYVVAYSLVGIISLIFWFDWSWWFLIPIALIVIFYTVVVSGMYCFQVDAGISGSIRSVLFPWQWWAATDSIYTSEKIKAIISQSSWNSVIRPLQYRRSYEPDKEHTVQFGNTSVRVSNRYSPIDAYRTTMLVVNSKEFDTRIPHFLYPTYLVRLFDKFVFLATM